MVAEAPAPGGQLALPDGEPTSVMDGLRIRESTRAKRLSIHVCPHKGVEVVVPRSTSAARVQRFVEEQRAWIEQTRARLVATPCAAFDQSLPQRIDLRAIDGAWRLTLGPDEERGGVQLNESASEILLRGHTADTVRCRDVLRRWLAAKGRTYLVPWIARLAKHHGFEHGRIQVRGQKTRWGSCSSRGTLSLNYSLLFLEPSLVRYLMLHELAHTRVMAHNDRFWSLVCAMEPRARQLDRQLNEAWRDIPGWAIPR